MKKKLSLGIVCVLVINMLMGTVVSAADFGEEGTLLFKAKMTPSNGAAQVDPAVTDGILLEFEQNVMINKDTLRVFLKGNDSVQAVNIIVGISGNGSKQIIIRVPQLKYATTYRVQAETGNFVDANDKDVLSASINYSFTTKAQDGAITTPDSPTSGSLRFTGVTPVPNSHNIALNTEFMLTFDRNITIKDETGIVVQKKGSDSKVPVTITVSGSGVFIKPIANLEENTTYYLSVASGTFVDPQTGEVNLGSSKSSFTTTKASNKATVIQQASIQNNSTIRLEYSNPLGLINLPEASGFKVTINGKAIAISKISTSGNSLTIVLETNVGAGEVVSVSYTPGASPLHDSFGQNLQGFSDYAVYAASDTSKYVELKLTAIEGTGNKITIFYNKTLKIKKITQMKQFSVLVNNSEVRITKIEIVSNRVILTLASSLTQEQNINVSFIDHAESIEDLDGNFGSYFLNYPANGQLNIATPTTTAVSTTPAAPGQPSYVTPITGGVFGKGGYQLNWSVAQPSASQSRGGQSITRYTIDFSQLQIALRYLITLHSNTRLVLEVPESEQAAEVAIPLGALIETYNSGKNASIAIKYNQTMYELPIHTLPLQSIVQSLNNGSMEAESLKALQVIIQLEFVPRSQLSLPMTLNGVTVSALADPVQLNVIIVNTNSTSSIFNISYIGQLYFILTGSSLTPAGVTLVKYDTVNQTLIPISSSVTGSSGTLMFNGKLGSGSSIGGTGSAGSGSGGSGGQDAGGSGGSGGGFLMGPAAGSADYKDTNQHWAKSDIDEMTSKFVVSPRSSNSKAFEPDRNITRAEFAEYIAKGLGLTGDLSEARVYPDVTLDIRGGYIGAASKAGIITGYPDGKFRPDQFITREEMALMMVRTLNYGDHATALDGTPEKALSKFNDAPKIRYKEAVAKTVKEGVIQGITTNTFQPAGNATRSQATVMIKRVLDKLNH